MRVTDDSLFRTLLSNLESSRGRFARFNQQVITGKKLNRPSDDPAGTAQLVRALDEFSRVNQYTRNIREARLRLSTVDDALNSVRNLVNSISERTSFGLNGTGSLANQQFIAEDLQGFLDEIIRLSDIDAGGKKVFSGSQVETSPLQQTAGGFLFQGDSLVPRIEVDNGIQVEVGIAGSDVFTNPQGDLVNTVQNLIDGFVTGDFAAVQSNFVELQKAADVIDQARVRLGNAINRVDGAEAQLQDATVRLTEQINSLQDADLAEAILRTLDAEQNISASLAAAGRLQQPTLFDILG